MNGWITHGSPVLFLFSAYMIYKERLFCSRVGSKHWQR